MLKLRFAAALCAALVVSCSSSFAQVPDDLPPRFVLPDGGRVKTPAPNDDRWIEQRSAKAGERVYKCKPLACSSSVQVTFSFGKTPTSHPDPQALEKFAKVDFPKTLRALIAVVQVMSDAEGKTTIETLAASVGSVKNYPAVFNESKLISGKRTAFVQTRLVFAGPLMVRAMAISPDRELAGKSLAQFLDLMRIEEGAPQPQPAAPERKPTQNL